MSRHIEWVAAADGGPAFHYNRNLQELCVDDVLDPKHVGLWVGGEDGAMLYGTMREIVDWLELAVDRVRNAQRNLEQVRFNEASINIKRGLSRDDETELGSRFEDGVEIIRNLNVDALEGRGALNYEYARGQVELLMDTTDWSRDLRPEKEDVFFYVFRREM